MNEPKEQDDRELRLCEYLDGQLGRRERRQMEQQLEQDDGLANNSASTRRSTGCLANSAIARSRASTSTSKGPRSSRPWNARRCSARRPPARVLFPAVAASLAAAASVLIVVGLAYLFWNQPNTVVSNNSPAPEVSVRMVHPAEPAARSSGTVMMRLARPSGQSAPAVKASEGGTVTVSAGGHKPDNSSGGEPMMIY